MDELFRFVALRPPSSSSNAIVVDGDSPLAVRLASLREPNNARQKMQELAESFIDSVDFVGDASTLRLPVGDLADGLDETEPLDGASVSALIHRVLNAGASALVRSADFRHDVGGLDDRAASSR
jgi:hypothetical protein